MNVNIQDVTITSLETISAFDISTGAFMFTLDELQSTSLAQSEETTDITGKGGRKLATLKRNKSVTISGDNGLVSGGLFELQTGSKFAQKATEVLWTDYLTVTNNSATTSYTAVGEVGEEIPDLYIRNTDGTLGTKLEQASAAAAGKFAYAPSQKTLTFVGLDNNTEVVAFYKRRISASVLENYSDIYSGKCSLYIDALAEDVCANVYRIQFYIPKADFNGEFTFDMGDNQTVHSFEASALAGSCGTAGVLWTYTIFGANTPDTPAPELSSISIAVAPDKVAYTEGELFNPAGMMVRANYVGGGYEYVNGYTWTPAVALQTSDETVIISYTLGGVTKTAEQTITVTAS